MALLIQMLAHRLKTFLSTLKRKLHNSESIIEFLLVINSFVSVLTTENMFNDLQSTINLSHLVSKVAINLLEQWFAMVECSISPLTSSTFRDWLQQSKYRQKLVVFNYSVRRNSQRFANSKHIQGFPPIYPVKMNKPKKV